MRQNLLLRVQSKIRYYGNTPTNIHKPFYTESHTVINFWITLTEITKINNYSNTYLPQQKGKQTNANSQSRYGADKNMYWRKAIHNT
jgi:hypothetical protein